MLYSQWKVCPQIRTCPPINQLRLIKLPSLTKLYLKWELSHRHLKLIKSNWIRIKWAHPSLVAAFCTLTRKMMTYLMTRIGRTMTMWVSVTARREARRIVASMMRMRSIRRSSYSMTVRIRVMTPMMTTKMKTLMMLRILGLSTTIQNSLMWSQKSLWMTLDPSRSRSSSLLIPTRPSLTIWSHIILYSKMSKSIPCVTMIRAFKAKSKLIIRKWLPQCNIPNPLLVTLIWRTMKGT